MEHTKTLQIQVIPFVNRRNLLTKLYVSFYVAERKSSMYVLYILSVRIRAYIKNRLKQSPWGDRISLCFPHLYRPNFSDLVPEGAFKSIYDPLFYETQPQIIFLTVATGH